MENLEEEHQKQIDDLNKSKSIESFAFWLFDDDNLDHRLQCEQFKDNLDQKEQLILKTVWLILATLKRRAKLEKPNLFSFLLDQNVELENLRNDHKSLIAENEKLNNVRNWTRFGEEMRKAFESF